MDFTDLKTQYNVLKEEIDSEIAKVLHSANYISGKQVKDFEEQLAEYVGRRYCVSCANGTDALLLALMAYGIKAGDAVFVPTFTFYASAETISMVGATPIFVDIDPATFNISTKDLELAINETCLAGQLKPRAIVAVDLFGLPADFSSLDRLSKEYNLLLIEDAAQGVGGSINGQAACSFGDISTTSFFPAKPLGCYGDGGAIFTDDDKVKQYLESIKVHGKGEDKYDNIRVGMNSRLDTIQAAILKVKLNAFKRSELAARQTVAELYKELLKDYVETPLIPDGYNSSYAQYSIKFHNEEQRNRVQKKLSKNNIPTMIYYKRSMHQQTVYQNNPSIHRHFPNAEAISTCILNIPMHPYLNNHNIQFIAHAITQALKTTS